MSNIPQDIKDKRNAYIAGIVDGVYPDIPENKDKRDILASASQRMAIKKYPQLMTPFKDPSGFRSPRHNGNLYWYAHPATGIILGTFLIDENVSRAREVIENYGFPGVSLGKVFTTYHSEGLNFTAKHRDLFHRILFEWMESRWPSDSAPHPSLLSYLNHIRMPSEAVSQENDSDESYPFCSCSPGPTCRTGECKRDGYAEPKDELADALQHFEDEYGDDHWNEIIRFIGRKVIGG